MSGNLEQDTKNQDIDLVELLRSLWAGRWLVGATSALALAISGAYVVVTPNDFEASITVRPLDTAAIEQLGRINYRIFETRDGFHERQTLITANSLLAEFVEVLLQRETIFQAANNSAVILHDQYQDESSYDAALRRFATGVSVQPIEIPAPSPDGLNNTVTAWNLTWQMNDPNTSDAFISEVLSLTNEAARDRLVRRLRVEAEQIQLANIQLAENIQQKIENAFQDYHIEVSDRLTRLSEQAALARVLVGEFGVGTAGLQSIYGSTAENVSTNMTYLEGYRAIEEQISILASREQVEAFVPGLRELQSELRSVEQNTNADQILLVVETTSLSNPSEFKAAQYDLASIKMTYHKKANRILALSLLLGGFVGGVTVLVRNAIKRDAS